jgi:malate dehydrogenase (oxaloacetate-decarboxylating)(NADP+)
VPESVKQIYPDRNLVFGREYIIPTPFDQRLMETVSVEVARTAMETGVARKPIHDLEAYKLELKDRYNKYVGRTEPIPPAKL